MHRVSLTVPAAREVSDCSALVSNEASTVRSSSNCWRLAVTVSGLVAADSPSGVGVGMTSAVTSTPADSIPRPVRISGVRIRVFMWSFPFVGCLFVSRC